LSKTGVKGGGEVETCGHPANQLCGRLVAQALVIGSTFARNPLRLAASGHPAPPNFLQTHVQT
jgi:hypothetical protein